MPVSGKQPVRPQGVAFKVFVGADLAALPRGTERRQVVAYPLSGQH